MWKCKKSMCKLANEYQLNHFLPGTTLCYQRIFLQRFQVFVPQTLQKVLSTILTKTHVGQLAFQS